MESLKMLHELNIMSERLDMPFLKHFFKSFDPSENKNLSSTITHFHLRDLESADYRSAYHQLCDWFYGWNVTDAHDYAGANEHFHMKRIPREINLAEAGEKQECDRIMRTFETLFTISRRVLKKYYLDIEEMMPRLGQGLKTMSNTQTKEDEDEDEDVDKEDIWKQRSKPIGFVEDDHLDDDEVGDVVDEDDLDTFNTTARRVSRAADGLIVRRKSTAVQLPDIGDDDGKGENELNHSLQEIAEYQSESTEVPGKTNGQNSTNSSPSSSTHSLKKEQNNSNSVEEPAKKPLPIEAPPQSTQEPPVNGLVSHRGSIAVPPNQGFQMSTATTKPAAGLYSKGLEHEDAKKSLQRDINHVYAELDKSVEYTLVCLSNIILVLSFGEVLQEQANFQKYITFAHELSADFVSNTLKIVWDLLNRELPNITLQDLRNPENLKTRIQEVIAMRAVNDHIPRYKYRRIHKKFELVHELFTAVDIHLFPNFVMAHKEGLKCAQFSAFDSSLWLTGGYDCVIRIHDIRAANNHICLSQYVGHRSIVTDVHFTRDDTHIVSASFDRTIKIWNAQSASCERTLVGHTDSVVSCSVTPDGRYIASCSMDCTIRIWDFNTGECISVIKKHTRWLKIVRFSIDGRYLMSAGLEHKVYVWDTKILINSRAITHTRCIESHSDYILDLATQRPSLLLTTSRDSTVKMFDYMSGHELYSISLSPSWACTVSFSSDGEYFATGSFDNNVIIFRTKDGARMRQIRALNLGVMCVRFPRDLSYVAVGTVEGFLQQIPL